MQQFTREIPGYGRETLYLAEECQHAQWFTQADLDLGLNNEHCATCDNYGIRVTWIKVWVER